jgi:hypothetical protein
MLAWETYAMSGPAEESDARRAVGFRYEAEGHSRNALGGADLNPEQGGTPAENASAPDRVARETTARWAAHGRETGRDRPRGRTPADSGAPTVSFAGRSGHCPSPECR